MDGALKTKICQVVNKIPAGKVTSYGVVGELVGTSGWTVGIVLSGFSNEEMEQFAWQRVVAKSGFLSSTKLGFRGEIQRQLLEKEGVEVTENTVDMKTFGIGLEELAKG
jgi:methylated-DNA-protein-cysteine methyltransferase-like protein